MGLRAEESRPRRISLYTRQDKGLPPFCHRYTTGKRRNMIRCCPLAQWTTEDVGGYILQHGIPFLDWYALHDEGFKERTTARLTGDSVRQNSLFWLKKHKPENFNILAQRFPEFRMYV
ncbi:phosphoadenosine phosphosulfate reductase family protein [Thermanaerosceptrum fracticalcis]|uniref:Phosphoadenosine phosphosulfate reductase family protein n=2 Tax=Thermanaerosceptrum fracticalcis TaxID=1712410 RepID=A0A7G6DYF6_THEFR|nr:phosphoadenosine phosphosulfate reductase family protein [Thermanaerosceptrum fracticalcis]